MTPKKNKIKVEEELEKLATQKDSGAYFSYESPEELTVTSEVVSTRPHGFYAYAPFEFRGVQYAEGDLFSVPAGLTRAHELDTFRRVEKLRDGDTGVAFQEILPPLSPKGEPQIKFHILPLKEA